MDKRIRERRATKMGCIFGILGFVLLGCSLTSIGQAEVLYTVIDLGTTEPISTAYEISNSGKIVGAVISGGWHATLFDSSGGGSNILLGGETASSVNEAGQIAGKSYSNRATLYNQEGQDVDLGVLPGDTKSEATSINNSGQIVGSSYGSMSTATLFDSSGGGANIDLGGLGGSYSYAASINNLGQIVGSAKTGMEPNINTNRATLFDPTGGQQNIDLGTLGGVYSHAFDINDNGQIVGKGQSHAALFDPTGNGANRDLGTLGGSSSRAESINNLGQIVGNAWKSYPIQGSFATLFDSTGAGANINLNDVIDPSSGWTLVDANDINDNGWIVGSGNNPSGQYHAFLLIPVPEPATLTFLALGGLALFRKRKHKTCK
jgi:uncharacterized membrane protein